MVCFRLAGIGLILGLGAAVFGGVDLGVDEEELFEDEMRTGGSGGSGRLLGLFTCWLNCSSSITKSTMGCALLNGNTFFSEFRSRGLAVSSIDMVLLSLRVVVTGVPYE